MRVTDARLIRLRDSCQLEAWVTLESMQSDPFLLWYRFPLDYITAVSARTKRCLCRRPSNACDGAGRTAEN